ncbi:MAG: hypothetical protein ACU84H_11555 [Gammaproteobacteria bacterium]
MKKTTLTQIALSVALPAIAAPALAGGGGPPPKVTILHCGCNYSGYGLELKEVEINRNALDGHDQHDVGSYTTCEDTTGFTFQRTISDCFLSGPGGPGPLRTCYGGDYEGRDCD